MIIIVNFRRIKKCFKLSPVVTNLYIRELNQWKTQVLLHRDVENFQGNSKHRGINTENRMKRTHAGIDTDTGVQRTRTGVE